MPVTARYPARFDELTSALENQTDAITGRPDPEYTGIEPTGEGDHATRHNQASVIINAIEQELGLEPSGSESTVRARLEALEAAKLAKASNLSDLVNAVTARENIGAAATSHTHAESDVTGLIADLEQARRQGLPEKYWPALTDFQLFKPQSNLQTANSVHFLRFVCPPWRNLRVRGLTVITTIAATNNDECAVAMKDETGRRTLAGSGAVKEKMNATAGRLDIDFTEDVTLEAGRVYYPGFQYGAVGGTAATMVTLEMQHAAGISGIFGSTGPNVYVSGPTTTFPFATEPALTAATTRVLMIVRER